MDVNFLTLKQIGVLTPLMQVVLVTTLFVLTVLVQFRVFKKTGKLSYGYPVNTFLFFAPIYEEIVFRAFMLSAFIALYGHVWSVVITSVLFGIWHIRSVFFMEKTKVIEQIFYTGIVLGPVFAILTILTESIWPAVILHFLNNLVAPVLEKYHQKRF